MRLKLSPAAPAAEVANLLLWGEPLQEPPGLSLSSGRPDDTGSKEKRREEVRPRWR
jgi:hypothetical protein